MRSARVVVWKAVQYFRNGCVVFEFMKQFVIHAVDTIRLQKIRLSELRNIRIEI